VAITSPVDEKATLQLMDLSGRLLNTKTVQLNKGTNVFTIEELNKLAPGTYLLRVVSGTWIETMKVLKQAN
jgi:hypothetical protein